MKNLFKSKLAFTSLMFLSGVSFANTPIPPIKDQLAATTVVAHAQPLGYIIKGANFEDGLPKQALEWLEIIKKKNPELNCPQSKGLSTCLFLGAVQLDEILGEYQIILKGSSFINGYVQLPQIIAEDNSSKIWFKKVLVNGKESEIIEDNKISYVAVDKSDFEIKIIVPKSNKEITNILFESTPLMFVNNIKNKEFVNDGGQIRLTKSLSEKIKVGDIKENTTLLNKDVIEIKVFRKIITQIPNILSTKIKILYSGAPKDYFLGKVLPEGFEFNSANSSLKIERKVDGFWIKLIAGENEINIESFLLKDIEKINIKGLIIKSDSEIWSLEQNNSFRQIEISGPKQVDPNQALVPKNWEIYPTYLVKDDFNIKTSRRGIDEKKSLIVNINRNSFFGFDGDKMFHLDSLNIQNYGSQFLAKTTEDINTSTFKVNNSTQVLVKSNDVKGVIIPKGIIVAQSQGISEKNSLRTQLWEGTNIIDQWNIYLAPRIKMFAITGDSIKSSGTWFDHWNLYAIFSVFLIVLTFYRLFGKTTSIMSFLGLMMFQTEVFSWILWLSILFVLGLLKVLPESTDSKFSKWINVFGTTLLALFSLYALDFIKSEIQLIINPSLEEISYKLSFINRHDFSSHFLILVIFVFLLNWLLFREKASTKVKNKFKYSNVLVWASLAIAFISLPSFFTSGKDSIFGSSSNRSTEGTTLDGGSMRTIDGTYNMPSAPAPAAKMMNDMIVSEAEIPEQKAKKFENQEIEEKIIMKKVQIGNGVPNWKSVGSSYSVRSSGAINKDSIVSFWLAPIWLVNIFSIFQIIFLISTLFIFGIGLLALSNKKDWFNKIPLVIRNNKLVQILILNDLQKGFSK